MQTKWYFIIAAAAVGGFAGYYQDYQRDDIRLRGNVALAEQQGRTAAAAIRENDRITALQRALENARQHRLEREARQQAARQEQADRDAWADELAALRDETAALRVARELRSHDVAAAEAGLETMRSSHTTAVAEAEFLSRYLVLAHASVARMDRAVEKLERFRVAAAAQAVAATSSPGRRSRP